MKTYTPKKPSGKSSLWTWRRWIWDMLAGGLFPIAGDGNVVVEWIQGVYRIRVKPQKIVGGKSGDSGNFNYRGLWSATPASPYMTFDVVQFGAGTGAGMYLSTIDNNPNQPDTGIGWTQVSSSSGTWL